MPLFNDPDFPARRATAGEPVHATPVLYVHGVNSRTDAFSRNARYLRDRGYWVWGWDYGTAIFPGLHGNGDLEDLVAELGENVDRVLRETGTDKVDIVAHSQGGLLTKLYIAAGGAEKIRRVVAMGANFQGTDLRGRAERLNPIVDRYPKVVARFTGPSTSQQLTGSRWLADHADIPDTDPRVIYTSLYSTRDHVVTPTTASQLSLIDGTDTVNLEIPGAPLHPLMPRDLETAKLTAWGLERAAGETEPPAL